MIALYLSNNRRMIGIIGKIVKFSVKWYPTCYDYGLYGGAVFEMWSKVKIEKLQNDPSL